MSTLKVLIYLNQRCNSDLDLVVGKLWIWIHHAVRDVKNSRPWVPCQSFEEYKFCSAAKALLFEYFHVLGALEDNKRANNHLEMLIFSKLDLKAWGCCDINSCRAVAKTEGRGGTVDILLKSGFFSDEHRRLQIWNRGKAALQNRSLSTVLATEIGSLSATRYLPFHLSCVIPLEALSAGWHSEGVQRIMILQWKICSKSGKTGANRYQGYLLILELVSQKRQHVESVTKTKHLPFASIRQNTKMCLRL